MTKKEKQQLEDALTRAAFVRTQSVATDVPPPSLRGDFGQLSKGWMYVAEHSDYPRVEPACSSSVSHGIGSQDKTYSQNSMSLYSTKLLALRALRHSIENICAERLRRIDKMIEDEQRASTSQD